MKATTILLAAVTLTGAALATSQLLAQPNIERQVPRIEVSALARPRHLPPAPAPLPAARRDERIRAANVLNRAGVKHGTGPGLKWHPLALSPSHMKDPSTRSELYLFGVDLLTSEGAALHQERDGRGYALLLLSDLTPGEPITIDCTFSTDGPAEVTVLTIGGDPAGRDIWESSADAIRDGHLLARLRARASTQYVYVRPATTNPSFYSCAINPIDT